MKWLRERETEMKYSDCYHWHYIGGTYFHHIVIDLYSEPHLVLLLLLSQEGVWPPLLWALTDCSLNLTESLSVSAFWLWISCHYIIFSTPTHFSFWFSICMIYFYYPVSKSTTNMLSKPICNNTSAVISHQMKVISSYI